MRVLAVWSSVGVLIYVSMYVFAFVNQHSCLCFHCACLRYLTCACIYACMQLHRRCSGGWGHTGKTRLSLAALCLLTAVQPEPNHYYQLETSFAVIWLCRTPTSREARRGKLSLKGTKVRRNENAEVGEWERETHGFSEGAESRSYVGRMWQIN